MFIKKICAVTFLIIFLSPVITKAQNIQLEPPKNLNSDGYWTVRLLLKPEKNIRLDYNQNLDGYDAYLKIGTTPNTYDLFQVPLSGTHHEFSPLITGLSAGRYYARITNSSSNTTSEIVADPDSDLLYSNEVLIIIEAQSAPSVFAPRGEITNATPTFEWEDIPGVEAYWIIFSSTPFEIVNDENDGLSVEGANLVWQLITSENSAVYGEINEEIQGSFEAPPLDPGTEYSYAILNVYEEDNPAFASAVFGGIIPMTYTNQNPLPKTSLMSPVNNEEFFGDETITFEWTEVPEASYYRLNILEKVTQQGVDATIPIYTTTTSNTLFDYPAAANLKNSEYYWNVVTHDDFGGGTTSGTEDSPNHRFTYEISSGEVVIRARNSADNSPLQGVEIRARALNGGVTPTTPFLLQASNVAEELVSGTYEFEASVSGYESQTIVETIEENSSVNITFQLDPLPAFVSGAVRNENGSSVQGAEVLITNVDTNDIITTTTDLNGNFFIYTSSGNFRIQVQKEGYAVSEEENISLALGQQVQLGNIILESDIAQVSGYILSSAGNPIQLATIRASKGDQVLTKTTNSEGFYNLTLSSGNWTLNVNRNGFVTAEPQHILLSTGDIIQNNNFTLTGGANQVTGFVREYITNTNGNSSYAPMNHVRVVATPVSGSATSTVTTINGQFTLNLGSGTFTIQAQKDGYSTQQTLNVTLGFAETISNLELVMEPNQSIISGFVSLSDGTELSDAEVSIQGGTAIQTSSNGSYVLSTGEGTVQVQASKSGYVSDGIKTISLEEGQNLTGVNFLLSPNAATIRGRVINNGLPVVNGLVSTLEGQFSTYTNQLGYYELNIIPGTYQIDAWKSGFKRSDPINLVLSPGQQINNRNFLIERNSVSVSGIVSSTTTVLRNANVSVTSPEQPGFVESTFTQVTGSYGFSLPAGYSYRLRIKKPGYSTEIIETPILDSSLTDLSFDVQLIENPASVSGVVTTPAGVDLTGVTVSAINENEEVISSVTTVENGEFELGLYGGDYSIEVSKEGYYSEYFDVSVSIGQNIDGLEIRLNENYTTIIGEITSAVTSEPIENVLVSIQRNDGENSATRTTDSEGKYSYNRMTAGNYDLQFDRTGYLSMMLNNYTVENGQQILLPVELSPLEGSISGKVTDSNNNPVQDATILATTETGSVVTTISEADGMFEFQKTDFGTITLVANASGFTSSVPVDLEINEENPSPDNIHLMVMKNSGSITGQVTDTSTGAGIRQVSVSVTGTAGSGNAQTDNTGFYEISNLSPGVYSVEAILNGYASFKQENVEITSDQLTQTIDVQLSRNNGRLFGRVTDQNGESLGITIPVKAKSGTLSYTAQTSSTGEFSFENVESGRVYDVETQAYGQGVVNTSIAAAYPLGEPSLELQDLTVVINNAAITGSTGTAGAELRLVDEGKGKVVNVKTSGPDGSFLFRYLPEGDYRLDISKLGYSFTPESLSITDLSAGDTFVANFSPISNAGSVRVVLSDPNGTPVSGSFIKIVSTDAGIILTATTGSGGDAYFPAVPANQNYIVRATKTGYESNPNFTELEVSPGELTEIGFQMIPFASSISGKIFNSETGETISKALVRATHLETNTYTEVSSQTNGTYQFQDLRSGTFSILSRRSGYFRSTVEPVVVEPFEDLTNVDIPMDPRVLPRLEYFQGFVLYRGEGVQGAQISIEGDNNYNIETNENGRFRINNFPVRPSGETIVSVTMSYNGITQNQVHTLSSDLIGGPYTTDDFLLPSGEIEVVITDGEEPLAGIVADIGRSGSSNQTTYVTDVNGKFTTGASLQAGDYRISIKTEEYLLPEQSYRVVLESDTTFTQRNIELPYSFSAPDSLLASEDTILNVRVTDGYNLENVTGVLFYKRESQSVFTTSPLTPQNEVLTGAIEAQFTLENIIAYVEIYDLQQPAAFISPEITLTPLATNLITSITVDPSLEGSRIRAGDSYTFSVTVRDGESNNMTDRFKGEEGSLDVVVSENAPFSASVTGDQIQISTPEDGVGSGVLTVRALLEPQIFVQTITVQVVNTPVIELTLNRPSQRVSNQAASSFSYTARDENGSRILLGEKLKWSLSKPEAGAILNTGKFIPNPSVITELEARVADEKSGLSAVSEKVSLYASIQEGRDYELTDGDQMVLFIPSEAIVGPAEISLRYAIPEKPKKFVIAEGTNRSYTVADNIYRIRFSGEPLLEGASLTLPVPPSLLLFQGEKTIGRFDQQTLQWELYPTMKNNNAYETNQISVFGQFAILSENQPLNIEKLMILPNPFSPEIKPGTKIGYMLSTDSPPAIVSLEIYNLRGQRVRQLITDEEQLPGRYGSESSPMEIVWDGRTDYGTLAANGRYILRMYVRDGKNELELLEQIILVK